MLPEQILYVSILTSLTGIYFYARDIFRGTTKPNIISWFFWALAPILGAFFQFQAGAGLAALPAFMAGFGPVLILIIVAIRREAIWRITVFDIFCGVFSFLALLLWIQTRQAEISIVFALLGDGFASIPTIIKSWKFPGTESAPTYWPGVINGTLALLTFREWNFYSYSFPLYLIVVNLIILFCLYRQKVLYWLNAK